MMNYSLVHFGLFAASFIAKVPSLEVARRFDDEYAATQSLTDDSFSTIVAFRCEEDAVKFRTAFMW